MRKRVQGCGRFWKKNVQSENRGVESGGAPAARRTPHIDFRREGGYYVSPGNAPKWWNWQTRHLEGVVGKPVRVQIPPSAPSQYQKGFRLSAEVPFFVKSDFWSHFGPAGLICVTET